MKLLTDFLPILLFFIAYTMFDIYVATAVAIAATFLHVAVTWAENPQGDDHAAKEAKPYQIKDVRLFLENAGVKP